MTVPLQAPGIVPLETLDQAAVLALNNRHAAALSWLTAETLADLLGRARFAWGIVPMQAALLAFDQDSHHPGRHFAWFRARHARFVYVDRVVVADEARGRGLARQLYQALFDAVRPTLVTCEVNLDPPNPDSDAFHVKLGFVECGRATYADLGKTVRYLEQQLP